MWWSTPWTVRNQKNKKHTLLEYSEGQTKSSFTKVLMMCSFQWTNGHFCSICSIWHFIYLLFIILINYHNGMERRKNYKMYATQTYADLYDWLTLTENHKHLWSVYCPSVHPFIRPSIWLWIVSFSQATFYHSVYPFIRPTNQPLSHSTQVLQKSVPEFLCVTWKLNEFAEHWGNMIDICK